MNIDVRGAVKDVLGFVGDQMKESRIERKERRKEEAERERMVTASFMKIFGFMMAGMMVLVSEDNDAEGYHSCVASDPDLADGVRHVITAAYEDGDISVGTDPLYYSVVKVTIENHNIVEAEDPVIVDSLSDYNFHQ